LLSILIVIRVLVCFLNPLVQEIFKNSQSQIEWKAESFCKEAYREQTKSGLG